MWLSVCRAQAPSSVVIARVAGDESIVMPLRAELSSSRFRVVEVPASATRSEALGQLAEDQRAQAALRAKPEAMAVELWVRASGTELVSAGPGRDPEVLALRVTEAMRARGLALPPLAAAKPKPAAASGNTFAEEAQEVEVATPTAPPPSATPVSPSPPRAAEEAKPAKPEAKPREPEEAKPAKPEAKPREPDPSGRKPETKPREPEPKQPEPKPRETEPEPGPSQGEAEPEPEADGVDIAPAEPGPASSSGARAALLYVEVGPAGVWSPGSNHLGPGLDVLISVRFRPYPTSSISLVGLIPLLGSQLENDVARVQVQTYGIGGFGDLHWPLGIVELSAGIGGLALISSVSVDDPLWMPDDPTQNLAALLGRVGASIELTRDLRVSASVMAGLTVKPLQLEFPSTTGTGTGIDVSGPATTAMWGRPLLLGTLSVELALPWDR